MVHFTRIPKFMKAIENKFEEWENKYIPVRKICLLRAVICVKLEKLIHDDERNRLEFFLGILNNTLQKRCKDLTIIELDSRRLVTRIKLIDKE